MHLFWIHLVFGKRSSVVVQICPKHLCIYGFVNKFWTGRFFERLLKVCGGSNLSTVLLLWGIYIKKSISPVRICLQTRKEWNRASHDEIRARLGWNLRRSASDEIKSASTSCRKADFIAKRFHPPKVDFFRRRRISLQKAPARAGAFCCDVCPIQMQNRDATK